MKKRKKYPKCTHYRDGKHRFGINHLSFQEVCMFRHEGPNDCCKCAFNRREWKERNFDRARCRTGAE